MLNFIKGVEPENLEHFRENPLNHIGLVVDVVSEYIDYGLDFDDLVAYGIVGLLEACQRYDRGFETKFSTYGRYWIEREVIQAFQVDLPLVRVPRYLYTMKGKVERGEVELKSGSEQYLESAKKIWEASLLSLSQNSDEENEDGGDYYGIDLAIEQPDLDITEYTDEMDLLRKALTGLEVQEQRILILIYFKGLTLKEICKTIGVSRDVVFRTKKRALQKLKGYLGTNGDVETW